MLTFGLQSVTIISSLHLSILIQLIGTHLDKLILIFITKFLFIKRRDYPQIIQTYLF